ncbi:MAG: methylated-DNA--[protein]-cysteine S-methyltransferase [Chloroflexota bacterium]
MSAHGDRTLDLASARRLHQRLRALGSETAPVGLLGAVLNEIGLAERYVSIQTPIGRVYVAFNGLRISGVAPAEDDAAFEQIYRARTGRTARRADDAPPELLAAISRHLDGAPADLDLDLHTLSEFERAVLLKALEIPRGEVRPYGWIAREIGRPGAVRAVGSALNKNPIPLLIPCHRVVRSDGQIGEYAFGSEMKRAILASEGLDLERVEQLAQQGVRFVADTSCQSFCLPTCYWVLQQPAEVLLPLRSLAAAREAGYRPCQDCRPVAVAV